MCVTGRAQEFRLGKPCNLPRYSSARQIVMGVFSEGVDEAQVILNHPATGG
jgi:hypothetical protein